MRARPSLLSVGDDVASLDFATSSWLGSGGFLELRARANFRATRPTQPHWVAGEALRTPYGRSIAASWAA